MPRRINKAIELLEQGQPVYCTVPGEVSYDGGREIAQTWADQIMVNMEHGIFDLSALDKFMRGLVDGGPTNSGHRTPAVIVELPVEGSSEGVIRANAWMFRQVLDRGVHGILLCLAETSDAVKAFVEACRFPLQTAGLGQGLDQGRRGWGGQDPASGIWGVSAQEYLARADVWPLNPKGEIVLGIKIENERALAEVELITKVPGIAFAEWGAGDMSLSLGYPNGPPSPLSAKMLASRSTVVAACREAGWILFEGVTEENVTERIKEGVHMCACREATARIGRAYSKYTTPVRAYRRICCSPGGPR